MFYSGRLTAVASADLGGLGPKQGLRAEYSWMMPSVVPMSLPWLVLLGLLALPSNRNPRAWLIWVPVAGLAALATGLTVLLGEGGKEEINSFVQMASPVPFGLAAAWLLGAAPANGRHRFLHAAMLPLSITAVCVLAFLVSPIWEELWDARQWIPALLLWVLLFWVVCGVVLIAGLKLSAWTYRRRLGRMGLCLGLPFVLLLLWLAAVMTTGGMVALFSSEQFEALNYLITSAVLALVSYALFVPFLVLSFTSSFYRQRLRDLLGLKSPEHKPPVESPNAVPAHVA